MMVMLYCSECEKGIKASSVCRWRLWGGVMVNKVSWKARESVKCRHCRRCHYFMSVHLLQCFANSSFSLNTFNLQLVQFIDMETMQMERRFCSAQQIHMHDLQSSPPSYTFPQKKGIYLNIKRRAQEYSKQHYFKVPSTFCLHIWNVIHPYLLCVLWALSMPCVWARLISSDLGCSCFFCLPSARLQAWPPCLVLIMTCKCPIRINYISLTISKLRHSRMASISPFFAFASKEW